MPAETHSQIASFIWGISNLLRGPYKRNEYRKVVAAYLDDETGKLDALLGKAVEWLQKYRTALITAAVTAKIDVRRNSKITIFTS